MLMLQADEYEVQHATWMTESIQPSGQNRCMFQVINLQLLLGQGNEC